MIASQKLKLKTMALTTNDKTVGVKEVSDVKEKKKMDFDVTFDVRYWVRM